MKKLIFTIAIIAAGLSVQAQTAGILVQPEFSTSNIKKGFFMQADVIKGIGLYADYKFMNYENDLLENNYKQVNAGLSYRVIPELAIIAAASVLNNKRTIFKNDIWAIQNMPETIDVKRTHQFSAIYSASIFSVLGGFETGGEGERITVGFGFNF